jgi:hypothetical protein
LAEDMDDKACAAGIWLMTTTRRQEHMMMKAICRPLKQGRSAEIQQHTKNSGREIII